MMRMTRRRMSYLICGIALMSFTRSAGAVTVPIFSSGPAVITLGTPSDSQVQPVGTIVFGRLGGNDGPTTSLSFVYSDGTKWLRNGGDVFINTTGQVDGDPGATYVNQNGVITIV